MQTLVQDTNDVFSLNSDALVPQKSIDHAILEADKNNEPVFYNTLAFDHPDYDISSSTPEYLEYKEYLKKLHRLATGGYKDINRCEELFNVYEMRQRNNWENADSVYDAWLLSNNTPRKWFPYKKFISMFPEWEHVRLLIYSKENLEQCSQSTPIEDGMFDFNDTMTSLSEKLSSSDNETLPDSPIKQKCKRRCIQLLCAEECSEEEPPVSYERKLDTVETGRNNEPDDTEKILQKKKKNKIFRVTLKGGLQCSTF